MVFSSNKWFAKKRQDKCLISLFNHIGIETGNRKESESISRIGIGIDKIQTIPNPSCERGRGHSVFIFYLFLFFISNIWQHSIDCTPLKLTVIKKAHRQVIADRIRHSVREKQKYHDIICQKHYQRCQKQYLTQHRYVEQVGYIMK